MAGKEATVYIVDVGSTMRERSHGRKDTNLDWALPYVWDKITTTVATGRKTTMAGILALRTDETRNELGDEADYRHITMLQDIAQITMPELQSLRSNLLVSDTSAGDIISALVLAIQMIVRTCKKLQYQRRIVLVTDARAPMQTEDLGQITAKIKEDNIELLVLGVDFDDAEYGFKEESKNPVKAENEEILRTLCADCNGVFGTLAQAVDELGIPRLKSTRPVHSFKGFLTLGNSEEFETALSIDVERYPKTMIARPPTASSYVTRSDLAGGEATQSSITSPNSDGATNGASDGLTAVKNARTYQVEDNNAPGGKRDVELDELAKGYEYGRTAVHIAESDRNVTDFGVATSTMPKLDIIGFVDAKQHHRYMELSRANIIMSQKSNDKASMALSSLVHALYELEVFAVGRFVSKENKHPLILLLSPNIEPDFECLYDIELPFAEDMRSYRFPPLDRIVTVCGKVLKLHRNLPSDELQDAMGTYVDGLDLATFGQDEAGEPAEYMPMDETYSPMLHRINQVIKHRAVNPDSEPPPPFDVLVKYSQQPEELVKRCQSALDKVIQAADVKKVPPKARGTRYGRKEAPRPLSELDVGALLAQDPERKQKRIDFHNTIPEFKQFLGAAETVEELHDACKQLKNIIHEYVRHSVGDSGYGKAVEAIRVMREEMVDLEEPSPYNDFLRELKSKLFAGKLGGERKELWWLCRVNRLGLIQKRELDASDVTDDEARAFMLAK